MGAYSRVSLSATASPSSAIGPVPSISGYAIKLRTEWRSLSRCRECAGTGPVVLKVVPVTGALPFQVSLYILTNYCYAPLFFDAHYGMYTVVVVVDAGVIHKLSASHITLQPIYYDPT